MDIKYFKLYKILIVAFLLLGSCKKDNSCPKEGYEYLHTISPYFYAPLSDSMPLGSYITLQGSLPKTFRDEISNTIVTNTSPLIRGPLGIGMIHPEFKSAVDSFELTALIGKIDKDTINFPQEMLKGFRTVTWDGSLPDSFKIKLRIKALAKGIYALSLKQQSFKDNDCALFKYFPKPGNDNQYLNYWERFVQSPSQSVKNTTYCIKVY